MSWLKRVHYKNTDKYLGGDKDAHLYHFPRRVFQPRKAGS